MGEGDSGFSGGEFGGDGFGDSSGFTGSEGANLGGDFSGTTFGEGFGDMGGLGGFGLDSMFSNPDFGYNFSPALTDLGVDFTDQSFNYGVDSLDSMMEGLGKNSDIFSELAKSKLSPLIQLALKAADKTGLAAKGLGMFGLANSPNPGKGMAGLGLSTLAGMANPALGFAMGLANKGGLTDGITSQFGNTVGLQGGSPADGGPGGGMLEGLAGMYAANRGQRDTKQMLGSLQSLYSQDSPYAQAMRQQLQRRDAAGGRRSQYGPREVELQARLAQMASGQIPAMSQLQRQQQIARNSMLQQGLGAFQQMGGLKGLEALFGLGGQGGMFERAGTDLINSGSLGGLFGGGGLLGDPNDTSWIPDDWGG